MTQLSVVVIASDVEQRSILQMQVDATAVAKTVETFGNLPVGTTDMVLRRIQDLRPEVILLDIAKDSNAAIHAIELLHAEASSSVVFAISDTTQPQVIIAAMRAGAREFLERPTSTTGLLEAFVRLTSSQRKLNTKSATHGKVVTFLNAKGGCGATTLAVNTAVALQRRSGNVALVDIANLGQAALHLNQKPAFSLQDALHNIHRLDPSLLEVYMTPCSSGVHLLAASTEPALDIGTSGDYARLFDALVARYSWVIVDASSRIDSASRVICDLSQSVLLVAFAEVAALWGAAKVQSFLSQGAGASNLSLVLNRFRKIPGFSDMDIEAAVHAKVLWKVPNQYASVSAAIARGTPAVEQNHSEFAKACAGLAELLDKANQPQVTKTYSLFGVESHV